MYRKFKITLLLAALICVPLYSQQYEIYVETKEKSLPFGLKDYVLADKPVIAIALSGGGARGLAQIGVLRALEEAGIEIDLVVGTSMGSIVGGLYSAGYSIDDLDSIARSTDWADLLTFGTQSNRRDLFVDQKVTEDRAIFSLRLSGFNPVLPTSFNDGQKLSNYLNILTFDAPIHVDSSFDDLKRKFRAVCTNLVTGEPVVINSGSLSKAMRASSSVTFFLAPVQIDSLVLVDGGLVANIPTEIARQNEADFVIAVNTTSPLWNKQNLDAPWIIADQIVSIPMKTINELQIKEADFVITPQLENILATDFDKADSLIKLGYEEGKKIKGALKLMIDSLIQSKSPASEKYFFNPRVVANLNDNERILLENYNSKDSISNQQIKKDLEEIYSSGGYEKLGVNILATDSSTIICLDKTEKPLVEEISLRGVSLINSEKISELFDPLRGNHYSASIISNALQDLMSIYRRSGYSLAEVQEISFDEESKYLQIFIDEGIISRIEVSGNTATDEDVITRELPISEGDFFKIVDVEQGLKNLRSTKLFEDADVTVREDNGQNVLTVRVIEKPTSLLRIGLRVDNEYRFQAGLDIREENLFGTGAELGFIFFGGTRNRSYILEQKANRIFNTYFTYKINAFYKFNDVSVYRDEVTNNDKRFSREKNGEYRQIYYGFSLGVGTQVERFGNLIAEGKYQLDEIKNIELSPANPYKIKVVSLKISSTVDTQDKFPYPERGIFFNGFYETAQTFLGGDVGFTSIGFEYKNYFKLGNKHVLSPKIQMSFGDKTLPLSQQYSIGGQESFFGMREYEFRGRQLFQVSLMYRYKFPFKIFFDSYFKARYDIGNVWEVQEQIRFKDLRQGLGVALSFDTPVGPAEFAVGRSFLFRKDLPEDPISWGDVIFYFSIGYYY